MANPIPLRRQVGYGVMCVENPTLLMGVNRPRPISVCMDTYTNTPTPSSSSLIQKIQQDLRAIGLVWKTTTRGAKRFCTIPSDGVPWAHSLLFLFFLFAFPLYLFFSGIMWHHPACLAFVGREIFTCYCYTATATAVKAETASVLTGRFLL